MTERELLEWLSKNDRGGNMNDISSPQPVLAVVSKPWRLRAWYEPGAVPLYRVEVNHIGDPQLMRRETIPCYHEPFWGVDAEDMDGIREAAEEMTKELEKELGEEGKWASLR